MKCKYVLQTLAVALAFVAVSVLFPDTAWANSGGVAVGQFTSGIDKMTATLQGVAKPLGIVLFAIGGLTWAFTRHEEGFKKIGQAFVGIGVVLVATTVGNSLFASFSAAAF